MQAMPSRSMELARVGKRKLEYKVLQLPAGGDGGLEVLDLVHRDRERVVLALVRVLEEGEILRCLHKFLGAPVWVDQQTKIW